MPKLEWSEADVRLQERPGWCECACLQMIIAYFQGVEVPQAKLAELTGVQPGRGVTAARACKVLHDYGLQVVSFGHRGRTDVSDHTSIAAPMDFSLIECALETGDLINVPVLAGRLWNSHGFSDRWHGILVTALDSRTVTVVDPNPWHGFGGAKRISRRDFTAARHEAGSSGIVILRPSVAFG